MLGSNVCTEPLRHKIIVSSSIFPESKDKLTIKIGQLLENVNVDDD